MTQAVGIKGAPRCAPPPAATVLIAWEDVCMGFSDTPLRVLISADATTETALARRLLSDGTISVVTWEEASALDLEDLLDGVDAVVALVDQGSPSAGVLLDMGAALGRGVPVILLLPNADLVNTLPSRLRELPAVVATGAEEAVSQRLSGTIWSAVESGRAGRSPAPVRASRSYVEQVEGRQWADESERRVAAALATLGARVVGQEPANDRGQVDLVAWIPALPVPHLNPLLIEVAGRRPNIEMKAQQLLRFLHDRDAQIGMLILADDRAPRWIIRERCAIVVLSLQYLSNLSPDTLVQLIMDGRNRLVHAAP